MNNFVGAIMPEVFVKMYPAKNGDAFLIRTGGEARTAILIDGGYVSTFNEYISQDLKALAASGYQLDLVVATHVDADHISGLLALIRANGNANDPKIIRVKNVLHNSLRSITGKQKALARVSQSDQDLIAEIRRRGYPVPFGSSPEEVGARQGSSLASLLFAGQYRWNKDEGFEGVVFPTFHDLAISPSVRVIVIGPTRERLDVLRKWWLNEMAYLGFNSPMDKGISFDDAFEFLCAYEDLRRPVNPSVIAAKNLEVMNLDEAYAPDDSATNGSSISIVVEIAGIRLLFPGDSWSEDIEAALSARFGADKPHYFDAIKLSHHGSSRNTSSSLLSTIDSRCFLISTDGTRHNHPDVSVLKAIVDRPSKFQRNLYFNYQTKGSTFLRRCVGGAARSFLVEEEMTDWIQIRGSLT
jgi:beta-lactamase superfamily II metal-dependent hydrolase